MLNRKLFLKIFLKFVNTIFLLKMKNWNLYFFQNNCKNGFKNFGKNYLFNYVEKFLLNIYFLWVLNKNLYLIKEKFPSIKIILIQSILNKDTEFVKFP